MFSLVKMNAVSNKYQHTGDELKHVMVQRNYVANKSGCSVDWLTYCKLKALVTKLNKNKKLYYQTVVEKVPNCHT